LRLYPSINSWEIQQPLPSDPARSIIRFPLLEMHAANAYNLTCESCSHFSNNGHKGLLGIDEADRWMSAWNARLWPATFRILGGEPTLNPHLSELVWLARERWPKSRIGLTTNGFFVHRHANLGKALGDANARVILTLHDRTKEYKAKALPGFQLLRKWSQQFGFELFVEQSYGRWTRRHIGDGIGVLPFEDGEPRRSWEKCPAKNCRQIFRGKLWKCSPIAYLQLQKETHPEISEKWDPYLAYQPLEPDCSDDALAKFFLAQEQSICGMCPAKPQRFEKASPLIPLSIIRRRTATGSGVVA
jgi:hypothetical protein